MKNPKNRTQKTKKHTRPKTVGKLEKMSNRQNMVWCDECVDDEQNPKQKRLG
jgi:hypothetical protein